jgi:hypothetical protein
MAEADLANASAVGEFPPFSNSFAIAAVVCKFTPATLQK